MTLRIEFPAPDKCLTMNQRLHWAQRSRLSRAWRDGARDAVIECTDINPFPGPSRITVHLPVNGNRRRDPHNWFPTVKPIIDGLVDAGLWPDDTPEWVQTTEPRLVVGATHVLVDITPMEGQNCE